MRKERVTLLNHSWTKDTDAGRVIASTVTTSNVACSVQPGDAMTTVDETGRWTTEVPYTLRFFSDPFLDAHDEITWVEAIFKRGSVNPTPRTHNLVVLGVTNRMGRGATYEVACVERI